MFLGTKPGYEHNVGIFFGSVQLIRNDETAYVDDLYRMMKLLS